MMQFVALFTLLTVNTFVIAAPNADERDLCDRLSRDLAANIVKFKGEKGMEALNTTYDVGTTSKVKQVSNYMAWSYEKNPNLKERELAVLGNSNCLAKF